MSERVIDGELHDLSIERFCAAIEWRTYLFRKWVVKRKRKRQMVVVEKILSNSRPSRFYDSDDLFAQLQNEYVPLDHYGYDSYTTWRRASERVQSILRLPELQSPGKRILEIGAGDGMTGRLLSDYGHETILCDIENWRDERAEGLPLLECDVCQTIPLEENSFDLVYSFNTFEHLADPLSAFREIKRLCRPQGLVILSFGPLYYSPWGLHSYRALNMPYPQFLFSRSFIDDKVGLLGIYDLAKKMNSLQPLNGWRLNQYEHLWHDSSFEVLEEHINEDWSHLGMAERYPDAFCGRNLSVRDLTTQGVYVLLRKAV